MQLNLVPRLSYWKSGSALLVTVGMVSSAIVPLTLPAAAAPQTLAQLFPSQPGARRLAIPAGTRLPVRYEAAEKVVLLPTETVPLTLTIDRNIRASDRTLLIPAGSQVSGKLKPAEGGSQFVADTLVLTDGTRYNIRASSQVVTTTQEVRPGVDTGAVLKGAAIGAAAASVISGVTGKRRITLGKILGGGAAGAVGGLLLGKKKADVVVVNPNSDLELTLDSSLALR
ncbi:MAG TPA: hypothetical protein V6D18_04205 [Thermosynechococcaceae cyanobacterium]